MQSPLDGFLTRLEDAMPVTIPTPELLDMSHRLTASLADGVQNSTASMLPCHIYRLPSGHETGTFLSVDLGGSTLRVALVQLYGINARLKGGRPLEILDMQSWGGAEIEDLKSLRGEAFFDWIAIRIGHVVGKFGRGVDDHPLAMGLSWSFPIGQTSLDSGTIHNMGKGFRMSEDLVGTDLKTHFTNAFQRQSLNISLDAIINDTIAGLASHAYVAPATRYSLILGTGANAAVSVPISSLPSSKKPQGVKETRSVLLNTELSMFGKGIFPVTEWDDALDAAMDRPGFQPFEYLTSGRYLPEIARRIAVDGAVKHGLFEKGIPEGWEKPYGVQTRFMGAVEENTESGDIDPADIEVLRRIFNLISTRAATYCAVALHSLVKLRESTNPDDPSADAANVLPIAFCGSTMEKYPRLLQRTQEVLDRLAGFNPRDPKSKRIVLEFSHESAILGAAVVVAAAARITAPPTPAEVGEKPTSFDASIKSPTMSNEYNSKEAVSYSTTSATSMEKVAKKDPKPVKKNSNPIKWVVEMFKRLMVNLCR